MRIDKDLDQTTLIEIAIKKAGSVTALAEKIGVRRETLWRWRENLAEMKLSTYREIRKWIEK